MTTIYLVRHGQASLGADDYDKLSGLGIRQATLLGEWWNSIGLRPDAFVAGRLVRHRESAQACLEAMRLSLPIATQAGFDEYDYEDVLRIHRPDLPDGKAIRDFLAREPDPRRAFQAAFSGAVQRWVGGAHDADYRESWPAFRARVLEAASALASAAASEERTSIAVFTSGGPITVLCQAALGVPDARILDLNWALLNAGVTQVHARTSRWRLGHFNAVPHLDVARDASLITHR